MNLTAHWSPVKLTSNNYLAWKLQFQTLFVGYDLNGFIDGSHPYPATTIPGTATPNPAHTLWIRQDQLLLNAILGSLSPTIMSFIAQTQTSKEAWTILANTYAKPSRGRIKQVKSHFKQITHFFINQLDHNLIFRKCVKLNMNI